MVHGRFDYDERIQDVDLPEVRRLVEDLLCRVANGTNPEELAEYHARFDAAMTGKIPADEPVFLLRGQDCLALLTLNTWIQGAKIINAQNVRFAEAQFERIARWPKKKAPDVGD